MFKFQKGANVIARLNKMNKKQIYTWVAIIMVCLIALVTMGGLFGDASDDASFAGMNSRGYDLAQMPFLDDEAESYLLSSKYPDMKGNNASALYTSGQKEARQEQDAEKASEEAASAQETDASAAENEGRSFSGRMGGGAGGGGSRTPTEVGQLNTSGSGSKSSGSGLNATYGAPRGDFSPYKDQNKGTEAPFQPLQNSNAQRALSQFAQTSRAAAGLKDGKSANAKRALMGGNIKGSEAFAGQGIDASKLGGLGTDAGAPISSADLNGLDDKVAAANDKAKEKQKAAAEKSFWAMFGEKLVEFGLDVTKQWAVGALTGLNERGKASRQARDVTDPKFGINTSEYNGMVDKNGFINPEKVAAFTKKHGWAPSLDALRGGYKSFKKEGQNQTVYLASYGEAKATYEGQAQTFNQMNGNNHIPQNPCSKGGVYDATKNTWSC